VFGYCSSLKSITIPNSLTSIAEYAFYDGSNNAKFYVGNEKVKQLLIGTGVDTNKIQS